MKLNPDAPAWGAIKLSWGALVDECRATVALYDSGQAMSRHARDAARAVLAVANDPEAGDGAWKTIAAMAMLQEQAPSMFVSDDGFWTQTARRFRALTETHAGTYWDQRQRRVRKVYRDFPAGTSVYLGRLLMEALGIVGVVLARADEAALAAKEATQRRLYEATKELAAGPDGGMQGGPA